MPGRQGEVGDSGSFHFRIVLIYKLEFYLINRLARYGWSSRFTRSKR